MSEANALLTTENQPNIEEDSQDESSTDLSYSASPVRNENEEVQKIIKKETKDVVMWREIVTGMSKCLCP